MDSSSAAGGNQITIRVVRTIEQSLIDAVDWLVPQISGTHSVPGRWELEQMVADPGAILLVAESATVVVGMLALVVFRTPTGLRARIEDLVVDEEIQDQDVTERLLKRALKTAANRGARTVDVNGLEAKSGIGRVYEQLGFERLSSNVYRYSVSG
jgi:GNAT superfamily N-acetyltransferase